MIAIVDYKMCNVGSVRNMLKRVGAKSIITSDIKEIENAEKIILPGVGSFDNGMKRLADLGLIETLHKVVLEDKKPVLGICLGMQLITEKSEEGVLPGLGWIKAKTIKFELDNNYRVPHMGWNFIKKEKESVLVEDLLPESKYYFVHSYHVVCDFQTDVLLSCNYGYSFAAAFSQDNIFGVQFHPEKSHKYGMRILKNFAGIKANAQVPV